MGNMIRVKTSVLDQARDMHGFTSDEKLAAAIGLSGTSIRKLRHGKTSPKITTLLGLQKLTGIPIEGLIFDTEAEETAA